ncbi:restriction endonuclease subunit S [Campylobacter upsaliensis]|nr:restriction endonuclease subunit S [Campylobacter upsaliensis]
MKKHTQSPYESSEISYKPSGIKWLGEIPKHWEICKLNKVSYFINGYAFESSHFDYSFSIPVIRIGDIQNDKIIYHTCLMTKEQENLKNFMIYRGDIVIALSGATTGKFAVCNSNKKAYINQRVAIIRSDIKILKYYLSTFGFVNYIDMLCNGSAQPNISTKEVGNFKIPLPPLQEQKEIAEFLDSKCEKIQNYIEKKQKLITLLQEKKQALINEAVCGRVACHTERSEVSTMESRFFANAQNDKGNISYKDSGIEYLGLIPHHWEVVKVKYIATTNIGLVYDPSEIATNENVGYPVLRANNIQNGKIDYKDVIYVAKKIDDKQLTISGDLLMCVRNGSENLLGKTAKIENNNFSFGAFTAIIRSDLNNYLYWIFQTEMLKKSISSFIVSIGIGQISQDDIKNFKIPLPPLQEQKEIAAFLDSKVAQIDSVIEKTKKQIELIKEYKNTLINEAVCGRINFLEGILNE